jgi:predicted transcriptional regulator
MPENVRELTARIVRAYVLNNGVSRSDLSGLLSGVAEALSRLGVPAPLVPEKPIPTVPVKKTITPDFLVSLEDGKRYKTLKRHLGAHGLTPSEYREKWGLPADYPMVAPNYSDARSALAKTSGLGRKKAIVPQPPTRGRKR